MDYLAFLQKEIHAAAFATLAEDGRPEVRIIDIMLYDGHSLYFLTAKGKAFYRQLIEQKFVAITGGKGPAGGIAARPCPRGGPGPAGCDV